MSTPRQPTLRQHQGGQWIAKWGGKTHYFGTDRQAAEQKFLDPLCAGSLPRWAAWTKQKAERRAMLARLPADITLIEVAEQLFDRYTAQGRRETARWYAKHLARFLNVHGEARLLDMTQPDPARHIYAPPVITLVNAFIDDLAYTSLQPRTIRHDVTAIKRLFNFAADIAIAPEVRWRGLAKIEVPASRPENIPPKAVRELIDRGVAKDPRLGPWLELGYFALLRPSETVRVVCAAKAAERSAPMRHDPAGTGRKRRHDAHEHEGWFQPVYDLGELVNERGAFVLPKHKTLRQQKGRPRYVVLSDAALSALDRAAPVWSTPSSYSQACSRAGIGGAPHVMRDSSASWLRALGVDREDIRALLGHATGGVSESYIQEALGPLRVSASQLAL